MTADPHIEQALHNLRMAARVSPVLKGWLDIVEESHHALAARLERAEAALTELNEYASNKAGYWQHPLTEKVRAYFAALAGREGSDDA